MRLGITIVLLISHRLTVSFTQARLEDFIINISEAKGRCTALLIAGIVRCQIILNGELTILFIVVVGAILVWWLRSSKPCAQSRERKKGRHSAALS
jgi:hypothetical protein